MPVEMKRFFSTVYEQRVKEAMALPPPRVDMRLPELNSNPFELPQGPVSSLRIQEEAQYLLEQLLNMPGLQADRDACLDHLQAITTSILFKTGKPDIPSVNSSEAFLDGPTEVSSPTRQASTRATAPAGVSDAIAPVIDDRVLFDAASHLFMSQLRARPLTSQHTASLTEPTRAASRGGGLADENEHYNHDDYVDNLRAARPMEEHSSTEDEEEDEDEESLSGSEDSAQEARRKLKHYRRLRQRQMRQLGKESARNRAFEDVDTWPLMRSCDGRSPPRPVASPPHTKHALGGNGRDEGTHKPRSPAQGAARGEATGRHKVAALRNVFHSVTGSNQTATAAQLAHALTHSQEVVELCGGEAVHEAAATLRALGHDITLELATFLLYLGYLYNAPGPRVERLVASASQPGPTSSFGYSSTSNGEYEVSFGGGLEADGDGPQHHHSRSSSRSSLHALDLSNCPPTILCDVLAQGPLKSAFRDD